MTNTKSDTSTKDTNFIKIVLQSQTFGPVFLLLCCELVMFSGRDWKRVWFMKQKYISENINVSCRQFHRHFRQLVCNALLNIVMKLLAKTSRIISREFREKKLIQTKDIRLHPWMAWIQSTPGEPGIPKWLLCLIILITLVWIMFLCLNF